MHTYNKKGNHVHTHHFPSLSQTHVHSEKKTPAYLQLCLPLLRVFLRPLPQHLPLNLPRRTLRHLTKHHTTSQPLMLSHLSLHPLLNFLSTYSRVRRIHALRKDVCARLFLGVKGIFDAYDASVCDGGVGEEDGFEFGRGDLEAGDFD